MSYFENIVNKWSHKVKSGMPDVNNFGHRLILRQVLLEEGWDIRTANTLVDSLSKSSVKVDGKIITERNELTKQDILDKLKSHKELEQQGSVTTKIYGDLKPKEFVKVLQDKFEGVSKIKFYEPKVGPNNSGRDMLFTWKYNNEDYQVH